jgi:hypothetical protein
MQDALGNGRPGAVSRHPHLNCRQSGKQWIANPTDAEPVTIARLRKISEDMLRTTLLAFTLAIAATPIVSSAAGLPTAPNEFSGIYEIQPRSVYGVTLAHRKLYLAVSGDDVTGYFDNPYPQPEDADVDDTCSFFLSGKMTSPDTLELSADYPTADAASTIVLKKRHDGAWTVAVKGASGNASYLPNCSNQTLVSGDIAKLATARPWQIIGRIDHAKAILYSEPSMDKKTNAYLVNLDPVAIQVFKGEWHQIDYIGKDRELVRWIRASDIYYFLER